MPPSPRARRGRAGREEPPPQEAGERGTVPCRPWLRLLSRGCSIPIPPRAPESLNGAPQVPALGLGRGVPGVALTLGPEALAGGAPAAPLPSRAPGARAPRLRPLSAAPCAIAGTQGRPPPPEVEDCKVLASRRAAATVLRPRAPAASYPRGRVHPPETPHARRRGEGAGPTNWGARLAALRSQPQAAAPATVRSASAPALRE